MEAHHSPVLGRVIGLALVAAVLALAGGMVVSTLTPGRHHAAAVTTAVLPLYYVTMESPNSAQKTWYPDDFAAYSAELAIRKGPAPQVSCAAGNSCGSIVVASKHACPTALTVDIDVKQGVDGPTVGRAVAQVDAVKAGEPVTLPYSYASTQPGLVGAMGPVSCT